jgi:prepilin-type N-terminal cleavage/methylation domain-containing protein
VSVSNQRGFSLIETMVVLVLVGIILGVVTPSFGRYRLTLVSERTRGQLIEDIRAARQRAITQHAPVIMAFGNGVSTTNITTYTVHFDANGDKLAQLSELRFSRTVPRDSKLSQVSLQPPDTLIFDVSGTLKTGTHGGTIAVNTADANDTLAVSVAGLVYRQ